MNSGERWVTAVEDRPEARLRRPRRRNRQAQSREGEQPGWFACPPSGSFNGPRIADVKEVVHSSGSSSCHADRQETRQRRNAGRSADLDIMKRMTTRETHTTIFAPRAVVRQNGVARPTQRVRAARRCGRGRHRPAISVGVSNLRSSRRTPPHSVGTGASPSFGSRPGSLPAQGLVGRVRAGSRPGAMERFDTLAATVSRLSPPPRPLSSSSTGSCLRRPGWNHV